MFALDPGVPHADQLRLIEGQKRLDVGSYAWNWNVLQADPSRLAQDHKRLEVGPFVWKPDVPHADQSRLEDGHEHVAAQPPLPDMWLGALPGSLQLLEQPVLGCLSGDEVLGAMCEGWTLPGSLRWSSTHLCSVHMQVIAGFRCNAAAEYKHRWQLALIPVEV